MAYFSLFLFRPKSSIVLPAVAMVTAQCMRMWLSPSLFFAWKVDTEHSKIAGSFFFFFFYTVCFILFFRESGLHAIAETMGKLRELLPRVKSIVLKMLTKKSGRRKSEKASFEKTRAKIIDGRKKYLELSFEFLDLISNHESTFFAVFCSFSM